MKYQIRVEGMSMFPVLKPGQLVWVNNEANSEIKKGDIIVYKKDNYRCHRVIKKYMVGENIVFMTKGDNNKEYDQYLVYPNEIIGRVEE